MKRARRSLSSLLPRGRGGWLAAGGVAAAVVAALAGGYLVGAGTLSARRGELETARDTYRNALTQFRQERTERPELDAALQSFVDRTLGSDLASTDSALRGRLNRIGEELGLADFRVATGTSTARGTPARSEFRRSGQERELRDEIDFVELQATVTAEGSVEQTLRLLHRIEVEPWIKRVESVRLEERRDGERLRSTIRLTTIFMPGKRGTSELRVADADLAAFDAYRPIALANPFRMPRPPEPPPAAVAEKPAPKPRPAPGFPYHQWRLTGVVSGPTGVEAWFRNAATGESRQLAIGDRIGEVEFVGFAGDVADLRRGEQAFRLQVGVALGDAMSGARGAQP